MIVHAFGDARTHNNSVACGMNMPLIKQSILNAGGSFFRKIQKMDFESKELILLILTIYDQCVSLINRATDTKNVTNQEP